MKKNRRHLRIVADQVTQQTCPHWELDLEQQGTRQLLVCLDCAAVIDSDLTLYVKHA